MGTLSDDERVRLRTLLPDLGDDYGSRSLTGGLNNRCVLVESGETRYLLRLRAPHAAPFVLTGAEERDVVVAVAQAGLGPALIASDPQGELLVLTYLAARAWNPADARVRDNIPRIAAQLRALHALEVELPAFAPMASVAHYADALARHGELSQRMVRWQREYVALAKWYGDRFEPTALCHNDLVAANMLDDGEALWLVDFEYACRGHPILDLASLAALNGYRADHSAALCAAYYDGQRSPFSGEAFQRVVRMQELLSYFWAAWSCIQGTASAAHRAYRGAWATQLEKGEQ